MKENINVFENASISRDDDIDIEALLKGATSEKEQKEENVVEEDIVEDTEEVSEETEETIVEDASVSNTPVNKKKSPLEELKEKKAQNTGGAGMIIADKDLKYESTEKRTMDVTDERLEEYDAKIAELDAEFEKRKLVTVIKKPTNPIEYIAMMDELSSVEAQPDGSVKFNLLDDNGNLREPIFLRARSKDEAAFDFSLLNKEELNEMKKRGTLTEEVANATGTSIEEETDTENTEETKEDGISEEKKKIVEILIDKTGLGGDFVFTDDEKAKIEEANTIRINEVKKLDIKTIRAKRSQKSFQDVVNEYNYSGEKTTICFPGSGFKASMKGMSYGEYADVSLSTDSITFDKYYKRLTVIYNKMTNISTGPFKDFDDFLKHFAYSDIEMALFGLYISTEKEKQEIPLRCGNSSCNNTFNWQFSTRSLIKLNRCADTFLQNMQKIATSPASKYDKLKEEAPVNNTTVIELPDSGIVCEMGIASAYDFLYNIVPLMDNQTFIDAFGENANEIYRDNTLLLTSIRTVFLPDGDGGYVECTGYKEILDALYNVGPTEIQILAAYTAKIQSNWEIVFSFGDVVCPHCGTVTKNLDISMDDLVFQTYNRLMSTQIDLTTVQDL